jgi:hypothetical protein
VLNACAVGADVPGEGDALWNGDAGDDAHASDARSSDGMDPPRVDAPDPDATSPDGPEPDAPFLDAAPLDAAPLDAAPLDAAPLDAAIDARIPDAALPDAALPDAPLPDAALPDATPADAHAFLGVCQEAALLPTNDTCASAIDLTASAHQPAGAVTYGDTRMYYQNDLQPTSSCAGGYTHDGFDAIYTVTLKTNEKLTVTVTPMAFDVSVYLLEACTSTAKCVKGRDATFWNQPETFSYIAPSDHLYFLVVDAFSTSESGCYTLEAIIE